LGVSANRRKERPIYEVEVFIYVNFAGITQLFRAIFVYVGNNIRSTPTWAPPLYRRPLSFCRSDNSSPARAKRERLFVRLRACRHGLGLCPDRFARIITMQDYPGEQAAV
jgi:hypothetical protein